MSISLCISFNHGTKRERTEYYTTLASVRSLSHDDEKKNWVERAAKKVACLTKPHFRMQPILLSGWQRKRCKMGCGARWIDFQMWFATCVKFFSSPQNPYQISFVWLQTGPLDWKCASTNDEKWTANTTNENEPLNRLFSSFDMKFFIVL